MEFVTRHLPLTPINLVHMHSTLVPSATAPAVVGWHLPHLVAPSIHLLRVPKLLNGTNHEDVERDRRYFARPLSLVVG